MQFLSRVNTPATHQRAPDFAGEASAGSRLPYGWHVDDRTLALRDGSLLQVLRLGGLLFETADSAELSYRQALREATLRAIGTSRFAVLHHIVRRRVEPDLTGSFADPFSARLNTVWTDRLAARRLYANELFVTLIRRPAQGRTGLADTIAGWLGRAGDAGAQAAHLAAESRALDAAMEQLVAALSSYGPRVLAVYDRDDAAFSEPLEFLSLLYNGELRPVRLPHGDIGEYLPYRRVSFGADTLELGPTPTLAAGLAAIVSIKDYPGQTVPGMLDSLLRIPAEMVVTQSFAFVDRQDALGRMNLALRRMRAADDEAISLRGELAQAKDDVAAGRAAYGEHHLSVMVRGASQGEVDGGVADVAATLTDLGLVAVREDLALESTFWAQFPGNFKFIARRALIGSGNFASFASYHNFPLGRPDGNHWGQAIALFETTAAGPYHFNFHHGDLGNFTVIGPSGSGKTVIVNFLLAQARRLGPRIVFFDKDRGAELFIRAIGGGYDVLRPGTPSRLNPLQLPESADNRRFLIEWLVQLAGGTQAPLTPDEHSLIEDAVDANFQAAPEYRRLGTFVELLRGGARPHGHDLHARLRPWWGQGAHAWLFDNPADAIDLGHEAVGFDMTRLLDDPVLRTPAMMYLFHRVDERLDGTPTIIVVDEGWKALDDAIFAARIRDWQKTIRKRNGLVGFATQNAGDALASSIAGAIVEQSATQIFTANPKAQAEDYCTGFGLSAHEFQLVRTLPDSAHAFLVKHGQDSVVVRLDLSGERDILAVLSGREQAVRLLDDIRARVGDDPVDWLPRLLSQLEIGT